MKDKKTPFIFIGLLFILCSICLIKIIYYPMVVPKDNIIYKNIVEEIEDKIAEEGYVELIMSTSNSVCKLPCGEDMCFVLCNKIP